MPARGVSITTKVMADRFSSPILDFMGPDRRVAEGKSESHAGSVGRLLKQWRERRRMSQLALAMEAEVSPRHLSFVETGRGHPSREMVLLLAGVLDVPPRARNDLLLAAGYAPIYRE